MKRTLFYSIISLYLALFLLSLMFPSPHLSTAETALLNVFIFGVVSVSTFYSFKYEKILSPLFIMTVFFVLVIWTGFHFIFSDLDAIRDATAVPEISTDTFQKAYYVILAGFVSFVGGYILVSTVSITTGKEKRTGNIIETNNGEFPNNRARFAISVIIAGMLTLKVLSQVFFNIGIAGVRPVSIPFGGVISFASKFGPMIGICLLFALELKRKNRFYRFLLLLFIASYVGLEILAVWKSAHLKIFLLLAVIYFSARGFKQLNLRSLSILLAVVVASMLLYTTVWEYRKVLKNYQIQRYESVPKRDQPGPVESVKNIHHRLAGGVINFFHALEYDKHNKKLLNLKNLFTQRPGAMTFVTRTVYLNPETVVVGRSASLWGNLYIYGRLPAVAAGFFLLGIISRLIFQYLYKREHHYLFLSIKALFIFWFLKLVMSGMIYHGLKEFIAFGFLILFYKFSIAIATGGKSKKLARSF